MGDGIIGWIANVNCILWTLFVCIIFALPPVLPVNATTMNYAAVSLLFRQSVHVGLTNKRFTWIAAHHWRCHPALAVSIHTI